MEGVIVVILVIVVCVLWERESIRRDSERDERIRANLTRVHKAWED